MPNDADVIRSLRSTNAIELRRQLLRKPHVAPLAMFVENLRQLNPEWEFPDFDPLDGGIGAEILFLFEKPGPKTSRLGGGSGFISRNNDDPTAEATFNFMNQAGIPRGQTITWNVIPGWNGTRAISPKELADGLNQLRTLLSLLPALRTIVLVGRRAQRARSLIEALNLRVLASPHPSPLVRASQPDAWNRIPMIWSKAMDSSP